MVQISFRVDAVTLAALRELEAGMEDERGWTARGRRSVLLRRLILNANNRHDAHGRGGKT
jgi:hypothetical protein